MTKYKYKSIADFLERRIHHGDYALTGLPAEADLAAEVGVSRTTVRKAMHCLVKKGILHKTSTGRVVTNEAALSQKHTLRVAMLMPETPNPVIGMIWHPAVESAVAKMGGWLKLVGYNHWDDPVIGKVLDSFDGIFLMPIVPPGVPARVLEILKNSTRPVVVLSEDLHEHGLVSVRLDPPVFVQKLLDHLESLGHRSIDCLSVQPSNPVIDARVAQWKLWRAAHGIEGNLIAATEKPYEVTREALDSGKLKGSGLLCTSAEVAIAAMRAIFDAGLVVGKDISVCVADGVFGMAKYLRPSLTCLPDQDAAPYLDVCLEWMSEGGGPWTGPLLVQPKDVPLFIGESTGPAPQSDETADVAE